MRTVEIKTNGKTYLVCDLPKGAKDIGISMSWADSEKPFLSFNKEEIWLPDGEWSILGFASSLSEKEWAGIVENISSIIQTALTEYPLSYFRNYLNETKPFATATESGKSWLEANGIADFVNPFLLIKK